MKVLVVGAGGIGGIVAARLHESGSDVTAFTTNAATARTLEGQGFTLVGDGPRRVVRARIASELPKGSFEAVVLCTQPTQVEEAATMTLPALASDGLVVCLQNGLCEARVAKIVGAERTVGAVVSWGARMPAPGVYDRTARGGFALGALDARTQSKLGPLARTLGAVAPVEITSNLMGKRWSKLALNAAISSLGTLGGDRVGPLLAHAFVRRLALDVMTEAVVVARARKIRLERISGTVDLEWIALTDRERRIRRAPSLLAKHAVLIAAGFRYRRMRSSMLAAIERGRPPAVDFLNGEIVEAAGSEGLFAPVNEAVRRAVWEVARNERPSSLATLHQVYRATRAEGP